jgi:hypothetical protein
MAKYVLAYRGGGMAAGEEEQQKVMAAWGTWFGALGAAIVDGGAPFGPSMVVDSKGATSSAAPSSLTGYSILNADSLAKAAEKAKGCPILTSGGMIDVYEAIDMGM